MKATFFFILILVFCTEFRCQTVTSSCNASAEIIKKYKKSADKLAVRRVIHIGNTYKDSVTINKQISQQYLNALVAVYNATALPARDTIVVVPIVLDYKIPYDLNSILITADSAQLWMKNLRNNIIPCGNVSIDNLLSKYYLNKVSYSDFSNVFSYHGVSFRTDSNCYINQLCNKFNALFSLGFGFQTAFPNNEGNSPNLDIIDSVTTNYIELKYKLAWGDCMAGCMYRRYWTFRVANDCSVEYRGCSGDPMPFNLFAGLRSNLVENHKVRIYPNPVTDKVKFEFPPATQTVFEVFIFNSLGQIVMQKERLDISSEIDVTQLNNGVYFLKSIFGEEISVTKILINK